MRELKNLDFTRLLGFETVSGEIGGSFDFRDETLGAKLGAKIGEPESIDSDARLKREISRVATRSDGLPIYSFKYLWDDAVHVGVMAQDLLRNELWRRAVLTKEDGSFAVDYAKLGLRRATLEEWQREGMAALTRPAGG